jgi:GNAT superfamily N-acetyltransferase
MKYRKAILDDVSLLAGLNHHLIRDEGHRNPMTLLELEGRMRGCLKADYEAVIFEDDTGVLAYALYRVGELEIFLRQFFVAQGRRRQGIGRAAIQILRDKIWPQDKRLLVEVLCHNTPAIRFWKALGFDEYSLSLEILPEE